MFTQETKNGVDMIFWNKINAKLIFPKSLNLNENRYHEISRIFSFLIDEDVWYYYKTTTKLDSSYIGNLNLSYD